MHPDTIFKRSHVDPSEKPEQDHADGGQASGNAPSAVVLPFPVLHGAQVDHIPVADRAEWLRPRRGSHEDDMQPLNFDGKYAESDDDLADIGVREINRETETGSRQARQRFVHKRGRPLGTRLSP
jgi:hypothetical protein